MSSVERQRGCQAVGIDLGTTYSSLSYLDSQLTPRVVADGSGQSVMPSVVFFDDQAVIVGELALQQARLRADRVVQFIKVQMGEAWRREFNGHVHTPESISAIILGQLLREAEPQIGPVRSAVITVPAYFTEKRRRATQQAGEIAGLNVIGMLNEPMAATLAYGLYRSTGEQVAVVYDLGGGTFDVTVVRIRPDDLEELATSGNRQLGGRDWDQCLIDMVADDFQRRHGSDPRTLPQALQDLHLECERAKRRLGRLEKTAIRLHAFDHDHAVELTRAQFEALTAHLVQATKLTTESALDDAGLRWSDVARVVLVGGSTHMPAVRAMLREASGKPPDTGVNPVLAVSLGAAIYARLLEKGEARKAVRQKTGDVGETLAGEATAPPLAAAPPAPTAPLDDLPPLDEIVPDDEIVTDVELVTEVEIVPDDGPAAPDEAPPVIFAPRVESLPAVRFVTAHGVGVRVRSGGDWKNRVLIPKNSKVPSGVTRRFATQTTARGGTSLRIYVTQGDTSDAEAAELLAVGHIQGLPPGEPSGQPVDVTMEFNEQGRVRLRAVYVKTGVDMRLELDVPGGLREDQVGQQRQYLADAGLVSRFDHQAAMLGLEERDDDDDDA